MDPMSSPETTVEPAAPAEPTAPEPAVTPDLSPAPTTALSEGSAPAPTGAPVIAPEPASTLPDNWRNIMAGEDEKLLNTLGRYSTPADMAKAFNEAQTKIRQGMAKTLPDDPTDEQIADYREANGIPAEASGYDLELDDGLVIGENDKEMVNGFLEAMHGTNATPQQVKAGLNAYYQMQEQQYKDMEAKDVSDRDETRQTLSQEWGADVNSNYNAVKAMINTIPESARDNFASARMPDGSALMNNPEILMWMANTSRQANPAATVVPNANNPMQAMSDEIGHIEKTMRENPQSYWKDDGMQKRYAELLAAQDSMR